MIEFIEANSRALSELYLRFVRDLGGIMAVSRSAVNPVASSVRQAFIREANYSVQNYLTLYQNALSESADFALAAARDQFSLDEMKSIRASDSFLDFQQYLDTMAENAASVFSLNASKDIARNLNQFRSMSFDIVMTMNQAGINNAVKGAVVKNILANSAASKTKESATVRGVRTHSRWHLLTLHNEMVIFMGSIIGETEFVIKNKPGHRHDGQLISLEGEPNYDSLKASVFHPNSNSLVYRKK